MELVFATNNLNKLKEVNAILPKHNKLLSLKDIGCFEDILETKETIIENAIQKAQYIYANYGYNCFADDTGLEIEALNGEPGVYSARYAGKNRDANMNMDKVLTKLSNYTNRKAQFKTVIAFSYNGVIKTFTGVCKGKIGFEKKGRAGFGYDPIFIPLEYTKTFAEISLTEKNKIGHRGKAIRKFIDYLSNNATITS